MFPLSSKMMERKSFLKTVPKSWGKEVWVVNNFKYCAKFLFLDKEKESSYHCHAIKMETFYCLKGQVALTIQGKDYMLNPFSQPKTIKQTEYHKFYGISDAIILEVSTHHDDRDVYRRKV